jgi:2-amino-4-hydroxy-6-hydroxymethyldihydropteridine diphosphokinase
MHRVALLDVVVGLGANLGDPLSVFRSAIAGMGPWLQLQAVSAVYQTQAIGPEQPDFLNAAVRGKTGLEPEQLLEKLLGLELEAGRVRRERWGPRTLDLDLLWLHDRVVDLPELSVPHPRLQQRAFALLPLLDVAPEALDPRTGQAYRDLYLRLAPQRVEKHLDSWL